MATHRSSLLLGGDTPVREDPTSVIVISEASKATDCAERGRAKRDLGWEPKTTLEELCLMMVEADVRRNVAGFSF